MGPPLPIKVKRPLIGCPPHLASWQQQEEVSISDHVPITLRTHDNCQASHTRQPQLDQAPTHGGDSLEEMPRACLEPRPT